MGSAAEQIRAVIAAAPPVGGVRAIPFRDFMDLALYGEGGFYSTEGAAGRRGDFITSAEVGPLFGAVLARMLDSVWRELGRPDALTVVDAGAGPGTLARSIRLAAPDCLAAIRFVAVEASAAQRARHPDFVTSTNAMPAGPITGVIIANELLDNLPFRLFVMDGRWREAFVVARPDGSFAEVLRDAADSESLRLPAGAPLGARLPVQQCGAWVRAALGSLRAGRLVLIDYATATSAELAATPYREWLRTYRGHERGAHYLRDPGSQDITAQVVIEQIAAAVGDFDAVRTQSQFLQRWGIDALVAEGRRVWQEHAARPTVAAMTMRSRVREAEALCAPDGLGAFTVLELAARG